MLSTFLPPIHSLSSLLQHYLQLSSSLFSILRSSPPFLIVTSFISRYQFLYFFRLLLSQLEPRWDFQEAVRREWIPYNMDDEVTTISYHTAYLFILLLLVFDSIASDS